MCYIMLLDIMPLRKHFQNALEYFENLNILEQEAALLSRCIYRMKTKLRTDKGLKSMEKLNRALLQFKYLNMCTVLSDFMCLLPDEESSELYVPSRNMLDYVLVRLQGVTCLMLRAIETAHVAATSMGSRICIGHLWKVALIVLAVVSRISFICRDIMKLCCDFYRNIKSIRNLLKNTGTNWLPDEYDLPECLATWLNIDWVMLKEMPASYKVEPKILFLDLVDSSDIEECGSYIAIKDNLDEIVDITDNDKSKAKEDITKPDMFERLMITNDFGKVVLPLKQLNDKVINLSSDSEDDSIDCNLHVTEINKGVKCNYNKDKHEEIARTSYTCVRDDVNDVIHISDNDNLESIAEVRESNELKQLTKNDNRGHVVSSSLLHINQLRNTVINFTPANELCEISAASTETGQLRPNIKKERKKKSKLSKKENEHETMNAKHVACCKEEERMENENKVIKTTSKKLKKKDKINKNFAQIINNLNSIKKLKNFMSNLEDFNLLEGSHKVDKLQLAMLRKLIKKYTHRAKKELISNSECVKKAKKILKLTFKK